MRKESVGWLHRVAKRIASSEPGVWFFSRVMHHLDRAVYGMSNGRFTAASLFTGLPVVTLTATGAKSGRERSVPLVGIPGDNEEIILIASNWGRDRHPGWYHNLKAHPKATLAWNGRSRPYRAREATEEERDAYWQKAERLYAGYAAYRRRTTRRIPIMILESVREKTV
jgi:deazaflavin-dependent oxidoreductase (nitroreductase family)